MRDLLSRSAFVTLALAALIVRPMHTLAADNNGPLVEGNSAFALDLYVRLKSAEGNLFFSPYSISTCLAMTYAGARGDTAAQMARTLHFDTNQNQLAVSFGELQGQLNKARETTGIELNIANGLWGQKGHRFVPAFLDLAGQKYEANLKQVDFRTGAEATRTEINDWVSHTTKGKISDLIQPGVLAPTTRLVLVNAIYFKGQWAHPFSKSNTLNAPFSVSANQKVEAPLMNLTADFKYAEVEGLQLLELPYTGGGLSMVILLPKATDGLTSVEGLLKGQILDTWLAQARDQRVNVYLPKFKMSARFGLAPTLAGMGMIDAFSSRADFSGMDGERDLFISAVVHKAFIDVNEEGTEAAAATGAIMRSMAVFRPLPIPTFRADHPFILMIRDTHSGSILFLGRVVDPTRA